MFNIDFVDVIYKNHRLNVIKRQSITLCDKTQKDLVRDKFHKVSEPIEIPLIVEDNEEVDCKVVRLNLTLRLKYISIIDKCDQCDGIIDLRKALLDGEFTMMIIFQERPVKEGYIKIPFVIRPCPEDTVLSGHRKTVRVINGKHYVCYTKDFINRSK